jgi:hypothetical protein
MGTSGEESLVVAEGSLPRGFFACLLMRPGAGFALMLIGS